MKDYIYFAFDGASYVLYHCKVCEKPVAQGSKITNCIYCILSVKF